MLFAKLCANDFVRMWMRTSTIFISVVIFHEIGKLGPGLSYDFTVKLNSNSN